MTEVGSGGQPFPGYQDFVLQLVGPVALHSMLTVIPFRLTSIPTIGFAVALGLASRAASIFLFAFPQETHLQACCRPNSPLTLAQSGLDVRDAAVVSLLGDVAGLLLALIKQGGAPLRQHIAANVLPPLNLAPELRVRTLPLCVEKHSISTAWPTCHL